MPVTEQHLPLLCLDQAPESTTIGRACEGCPLITSEVGCVALKAGETIVEQRAEIARMAELNEQNEQLIATILDRLLNLRLDVLVNTAFTPEGMRDHLDNDPAIQHELEEKQWGALRLDGRFVRFINRFGNQVGDDFLQDGGAEITSIADGLVRVGDRRTDSPESVLQPTQEDGLTVVEREAQRRQGHAISEDLICRQGGDEFTLLIRNVTPQQLAMIATRIQDQLTMAKALERYEQGKVPFIASVGFFHASEPATSPEITGLMGQGHYWEAFRKISNVADEGQRRTKKRQYDEMWEMTLAVMPIDQRPTTVTRPDDPIVAEEFLRWNCPGFMAHPARYFTKRGTRKNDKEAADSSS